MSDQENTTHSAIDELSRRLEELRLRIVELSRSLVTGQKRAYLRLKFERRIFRETEQRLRALEKKRRRLAWA